jgi:hypothetical protein
LEEGMTWKELFQVLKEKRRSGSNVEMKEDSAAWIDLLLLLDIERSFFSLRKDSGRRILVEKEKSSTKVLDYFFEKAWLRPILKSHPPKV